MDEPDKRPDMQERTCTIDGCGKLLLARGWCAMHYSRWRAHGDPGGVESTFDPGAACRVEGCDKIAHALKLCVMHWNRMHTRGEVGSAAPERIQWPSGLICTVQGCNGPRRKRDWCASHYAQWQRTGIAEPFKYKWTETLVCVVCGAVTGVERGFRKFCSDNCKALWSIHKGNVPMTATCCQCGKVVDLTILSKTGKRKRSDTKLCRRCKSDIRKHGVSVEQLAVRDGTDCQLCSLPVDMTATFPDHMRASVDHIKPRAHGGSNDPENLQLTHLHCNQRKSDRVTIE